MKKIILIRHAKSSWKYDVSDMHRPIKKVGIFNTIKVTNTLQSSIKFTPDSILSSPAKRALDTANVFAEHFNSFLPEIVVKEDLYDFEGSQLKACITQLSADINSVLVFGHNNAFTNFVNTFGDRFIAHVPTSGVVILEFDIDDWAALKKGKTILTLFPKLLA